MTELEDAIRIRLCCGEELPPEMLDYTISDGRAIFRVENLFEASVTLSGTSPEDRWYLLSVEFLLNVVGDERGERFPRVPSRAQRTAILAKADAELAPREAAPEAANKDMDRVQELVEGEAQEENGPGDSSDGQALARLFQLLRAGALSYQLDALYDQAQQMLRGEWRSNIDVQMRRGRSLALIYWSNVPELQRQRPSKGGSEEQNPLVGGTLTISIPPGEEKKGKGRCALSAEWTINQSVDASIQTLDATSLDLPQLIRKATSEHAARALQSIAGRCPVGQRGDLQTSPDLRRVSCEVPLTPGHDLEVSINCTTGRLEFAPANVNKALSASEVAKSRARGSALMSENASKVIADPSAFESAWRRLQKALVVEDLQRRLTFQGLQTTDSFPIAETELYKIDPMREMTFLWIPLERWQSYYLLLGISSTSARAALIGADFPMVGPPLMQIFAVQWLNRSRFREPNQALQDQPGFELTFSNHELSRLYACSLAVVAYLRIEQQLTQRQIPFAHVQSAPTGLQELSGAAIPEELQQVGQLVPTLSLAAGTLFGEMNALIKPNVLVRLHRWWDAERVAVQFALRWKSNLAMSTSSSKTPEGLEVSFDKAQKVMIVTAQDVDTSVDAFRLFALRISRVAILARAVLLVQRAQLMPKLKLKELTLDHVTFEYSGQHEATVTSSMQDDGRWCCWVSLDSKADSENPHKLILKHLEHFLDHSADTNSIVHWLRFLRLLRDSGPVLSALQELQDKRGSTDSFRIEAIGVSQVLVFFSKGRALDIRLISRSRLLLTDAIHLGLEAGTRGNLGYSLHASRLPLPDFEMVVQETFEQCREEVSKEASAGRAAEDQAEATEWNQALLSEPAASGESGKTGASAPLLVNLKRGLLCSAREAVARPVVQTLVKAILSHHDM